MCCTEGPLDEGSEKVRDKVPPHLWRVHGHDYDLTGFAALHPGGATAIDLGRGADCTRLFESYHVMSEKHRHVLQRCLSQDWRSLLLPASDAGDGKSTRACQVPSSSSAFHVELKALLQQHFRGRGAHAHRAKTEHGLAMLVVLLGYAAAWWGWLHGSYSALLALPLLAWLVVANLAHDGSHFAVSRHAWVNQLCLYGASPLFYAESTWYVAHIISHHLDTNDCELDVDLHHGRRWHPQQPVKEKVRGWRNLVWHAVAFMGSTLFLALVQPLTKFVVPGCLARRGAAMPEVWASSAVFDDLLRVRFEAGFATASRLATNALLWASAVAVVVFPVLACGPTFKAALFGLYPFVVASILFMVVTQCSHVQRETQTRAALNEEDFFKRQALTSMDYAGGSGLTGFLTGGLNTQSLHHVAPSVHSSHYPDLYPKFYQLCLKHGCPPPRASGLGEALCKHLRYVYALGDGYRLPSPEM